MKHTTPNCAGKTRIVARLVPTLTITLLLGLWGLVLTPSALANGAFFQRIPESYEKSCNLCHSQPPLLNDFGRTFKENGFAFASLAGNSPQAGGGTEPDQAARPDAPVGEPADQEKLEPAVELLLPGASISRGEKIQLEARITAEGRPLQGKEVHFFEKTSFFVEGAIELGSATTDKEGVAHLAYWPRAIEEKVTLGVRVAEDSQVRSAVVEAPLALSPAGSLVKPVERLEIPFLGAWLVILLVGAVWAMYVFILLNALRIRKLAEVPEERKVSGVA